MEIIENKALLLKVNDPDRITGVIPKSKLMASKDNYHEVLVNWGLEEAQVLKNLKIKNVPSPITAQYDWPGLYKPFDHLQSCQWSIYTLQLSVYARLYEMEFPNRKCRQIYVLYWDKVKESFEKIQIMYLKHEAQKLIELHHYNIMKDNG